MFPEKKRIGIIGGGQLGKMLIEASRPWNVYNVVLENDLHCPASLVADMVLQGGLYDEDKIRELAALSDVLTYEIEHVHVDVLLELETAGKTIIPSPRILKIIQDKGSQKEFYAKHNLHTAPFFLANSNEELQQFAREVSDAKMVIKSRTGGYDGKGVHIVNTADVVNGNFQIPGPCVLEKFYENVKEFAVIVARDAKGNSCTFPLIEMYFNEQSNLVEFLFSPARIANNLEETCKSLATKAIDAFDGVGLFAVELFVTEDNEVLINEIAPRPHNSGHHTIEGCYTSQFEQLNRILLGLPLGSTALVKPSAMINLVGPEGLDGNYNLEHTEKLLQMEGVYVHLYNKKMIKPFRKMGHVTVMADDLNSLLSKAEEVKKCCTFVQAG